VMDKTREEKLLAAIGDIDDELIVDADELANNVVLFPRKRRWQSVALTAACFLLCVGVWFSVGDLFSSKSTSSAAPQVPAAPPQAMENPSESYTETIMTDSIVSEEESAQEEMKEFPQTSTTPQEPEITPGESVAVQANPTTGGSGTGGSNGIVDGKQKYSTYNAPLLPLTAVGDTDGILAERDLGVSVGTEDTMTVLDTYMLSNCVAEDKVLTLQYRYGTNLSCDDEVEMTVDISSGEQKLEISENISTYRSNGNFTDPYNSWETYSQRLDALDYVSDSEIRYNEEETVYVYSLSNITLPGGTGSDVQTQIKLGGREDGLVLFSGLSGYYVKENGVNAYTIYPPKYSDYPLQIIAYGEELDIDVIAEREGQELKTKVHYDVSAQSMTLREALIKQYRQYVVMEGKQVVSAVNEEQIIDALLYQLNDLPFYNADYQNQAIVQIEELIYDTIHSQRLFILEQTVTIPAGESIHISISAEKRLSSGGDMRGFEIIGQNQTAFDLGKVTLDLTVDASVTRLEHNLTEESGRMELHPAQDYYADFSIKP